MALEVRKKERETSQILARRFTQRVRRSGILIRARKNRYKKKEISEQIQKRKALRKVELRKKYEKLQKLGKTER